MRRTFFWLSLVLVIAASIICCDERDQLGERVRPQ
jgi:hypothetical protein